MKPENDNVPREGDDPSVDAMKTIAAPEDATIQLPMEGTPPTGTSEVERSAEPGARIELPSGFDLIEEIGRGGMGVIFRAQQRTLARQIAIKKLKDRGAGNEHLYLQFLSEALVAGQLDHPNIVPVYALEADSDGSISLAMKLVEGTSWQIILDSEFVRGDKAKTYTLEQHLDILLNVCNAITFAHSRFILHRDLKPENVMIGEYGEVYVMDWGIALSITDDPGREGVQRARHKSLVKSIAGTPAFMAPEMAEADGDRMGPWTDVYLLGGILFAILARRPPHRTTTVEESLEDARKSIVVFPENCNAPDPLRRICTRAMARDTGDRYQSVAEFSEEIRAYLRHRESLAISSRASARLARARARPEQGRAGEGEAGTDRVYTELFEVIAAFDQALVLWSGNREAEEGGREGRLYCASLAYQRGDYGLSKSQLQDSTEPEARQLLERAEKAMVEQQQSTAITRRLRRTLMAAGALVLALVVSVGFAMLSTRAMGLSISDAVHELLIARALADLRVNHAAVSATTTRLNIEKAEMALQAYAQALEAAFSGPSPEVREPVYYSSSVDTGINAPPGLVRDPLYEHEGPDGQRIASPVTFSEQTFVLAAGVREADVRDGIAKAQQVLPRLKDLRSTRTSHVIRYFTGMETGLYFAYPGHGNMPDGYDNRVRPWYIEGRTAETILQTRPYIDASSQRVVVSFEKPVHAPGGELLGVSGVDVDVTQLIHTSDLPDEWAQHADVEIATPRRGEGGEVTLELKGRGSSSGEGTDHARRMSLTDWDVNTTELADNGDPAFQEMATDMERGITGVARLAYEGTPSLWAYAPIGLDGSSILIIVPEETVTGAASFVRDRIRSQAGRHITRLVAAVVALFLLVAAGTWIGLRGVQK